VKSENDRLQNVVKTLQSELESAKAKANFYDISYKECQKQLTNLKQLCEHTEISSRNILKDENFKWQKVVDEIKELNDKELSRRQQSITLLSELCNSWIKKFPPFVLSF